MNAFIAKCFGILISVMSVLVLAALIFAIVSAEPVTNPVTGKPALAWVVGLVLFVVYVVIVGALSVAIHTRELAEQQVEILKQIQFQLTQNNAASGTALNGERKDPVI